MSLDLGCVGRQTRVHEFAYDWKTTALYALGIGAKATELDYLYEPRGPKVYPSFAVVPSYPLLSELLELSQGPYDQVIHGGQTIRALGPIPERGVMKTVGRITALYDLKLLAQMVFETKTEIDGKPVFETEWEILFRGEGGFGGPRRPKPSAPNAPKREPDWTFTQRVSEEQALLYRLSGDLNPLHADPQFAASVGFTQGPILHGLATFGFVCRAVAQKSCDGDASRIRSLTAQFKKPVWPGETLEVQGFAEGERVLLQARVKERDEIVVANCMAQLGD